MTLVRVDCEDGSNKDNLIVAETEGEECDYIGNAEGYNDKIRSRHDLTICKSLPRESVCGHG